MKNKVRVCVITAHISSSRHFVSEISVWIQSFQLEQQADLSGQQEGSIIKHENILLRQITQIQQVTFNVSAPIICVQQDLKVDVLLSDILGWR